MRSDGVTRGKWRILDGKGESDLFLYSKLRRCSPHLCRLWTDQLAPVNKFDYVLTHMGFIGPHKLSSFDCR
jgi:hypothetical protein